MWVVIRGVVYDVGAFSALSPPCGEASINALNGEDATKHFEAVAHSAEAKNLLQNMAIGTYVDPDTDPVLECDVHSMGSPLTDTEYVLAYYLALNSRNSAAVETEAEESVLQWLKSPLFHGGLFEVPYEEEKVRINDIHHDSIRNPNPNDSESILTRTMPSIRVKFGVVVRVTQRLQRMKTNRIPVWIRIFSSMR